MPFDFRLSHQVGTLFRMSLQMMLTVMLATFAMSAHSASKAVVVLGDSLSAEYGLERGRGWVSLLQKKMEAERIKASIVNASISGETTSGGRARLQAILDKHHPDIVVIELGANDALRGLSLAATKDNLRAMTASAQKAGARVLIVGMQIPPNYGAAYAGQFAAIFPDVAKQSKAALVPFMLAGVVERPELFQADRIHPTAEAHPMILNNIWPELKRLVTAAR
jgi:acyl-CoA thioesterase-1